MHYIIHAYDHTDPDALDRRMAARPAHLAYVSQLKAKDQFVLGGALLDPDGKMIGSMLMLNLETEDHLNEYLKKRPVYCAGRLGYHRRKTLSPSQCMTVAPVLASACLLIFLGSLSSCGHERKMKTATATVDTTVFDDDTLEVNGVPKVKKTEHAR